MDEHGEAVEADLLREYGVDILDWYAGKVSTRRVLNLIRRLPAQSNTARATEGDEALWGYKEHLLASILDVLQHLDWAFVAANSEGKTGDPPKPIPRPGQADNVTVVASSRDEVKGWFMGL